MRTHLGLYSIQSILYITLTHTYSEDLSLSLSLSLSVSHSLCLSLCVCFSNSLLLLLTLSVSVSLSVSQCLSLPLCSCQSVGPTYLRTDPVFFWVLLVSKVFFPCRYRPEVHLHRHHRLTDAGMSSLTTDQGNPSCPPSPRQEWQRRRRQGLGLSWWQQIVSSMASKSPSTPGGG